MVFWTNQGDFHIWTLLSTLRFLQPSRGSSGGRTLEEALSCWLPMQTLKTTAIVLCHEPTSPHHRVTSPRSAPGRCSPMIASASRFPGESQTQPLHPSREHTSCFPHGTLEAMSLGSRWGDCTSCLPQASGDREPRAHRHWQFSSKKSQFPISCQPQLLPWTRARWQTKAGSTAPGLPFGSLTQRLQPHAPHHLGTTLGFCH